MSYLAAGLLMWILFHSMKRISPLARKSLTALVGVNGSKGIIALGVIISLTIIIIGYRMSNQVVIYEPPAFGIHINNLLMIVSVGLVVLGHGKSRLRRFVRHPMLTGLVVWAIAHLFVNGDARSILLFGVLAIWSIILIIFINKAEPNYDFPEGLSLKGDVRWVLFTLLIFSVVAYAHLWIGVDPFSS